ncbi:DUF4432 family protein [Streptomyces sp. NPDC001508]|uniref:DUF4432 family protein n=1 Tax=Streptomyces sp. NPDC001508 TaxID=3154656 RepID=UPI00332B6F34
MVASATLHNEHVRVTVLTGKGCDIHELCDLTTGVDVLAKARVQLSDLQPGVHAPDSAEAWLAQYVGGWQVLLPNGGAPGRRGGAEWGFHGEASQLRWNVTDQTDTRLDAYVRLLRAPLLVTRRLEIAAATVRVTESVQNEGATPLELMWVHHPAFGAPFLDAGCLLSAGARTVVADDENPGTALIAGSVNPWPKATTRNGGQLSLDEAPGPDSGIAHLAYLSDFESGYFAITNPGLRLGVALSWDTDVFPHAWYWAEARATSAFPFFGRHYTLAIEPATSVPAQGIDALAAKTGKPLILAPGQTIATTLEATLFHDDRRVAGVRSGRIEFVEAGGPR